MIDKNYFTQLGETAAMTKKSIRSSETDAAIERQADRLACFILMPKGTVKKAFYRTCANTSDVVADLAELFAVSRQAMGIRLKEMRLIV